MNPFELWWKVILPAYLNFFGLQFHGTCRLEKSDRKVVYLAEYRTRS